MSSKRPEDEEAGERGNQVERLLEDKRASLQAYVRRRWRRSLERKESLTDIVQSVCRRALHAARRFRPMGPRAAFGWLRTIADNCLRDKHRALTAERRDVDQELQMGDLEFEAPSERSPLEEVEALELEARLRAAIERLPQDQREVMELRSLKGLTREEVAEHLGRSIDAIDALLRRARLRLSRDLEDPRSSPDA